MIIKATQNAGFKIFSLTVRVRSVQPERCWWMVEELMIKDTSKLRASRVTGASLYIDRIFAGTVIMSSILSAQKWMWSSPLQHYPLAERFYLYRSWFLFSISAWLLQPFYSHLRSASSISLCKPLTGLWNWTKFIFMYHTKSACTHLTPATGCLGRNPYLDRVCTRSDSLRHPHTWPARHCPWSARHGNSI